MTRLLRFLAYGAVGLFWTVMIILSGVNDLVAVFALVWVWVASIAVGLIVDHTMARGTPSGLVIISASLMSLLVPLIILLACRNPGPGRTAKMELNNHGTLESTGKPTVDPGKPVMTTTGDIMATNAESYDIGRESAFDPPRKFGRSTTDIRPVLIGTNKWRICFQTPGPAMIMTGLSFKQGDTYYIKMDREAESIQFGWLEEDERGRTMFAPLQVPANVLVDSLPFKYTKSSPGNNAQLAFNVATIPDGRYEIEITKSQFFVGLDEYTLGVPLKNQW